MAKVKPFKGVRPTPELAASLSSRPYDVLSSNEARQEAAGNEHSLYHIIKPEIDFQPGVSEHDPEVYKRAVENFKKFQENQWIKQDETDSYYIYAQEMQGRTQYGIVVAASVEDYLNGTIKKHELTRVDKEEDRMHHVRINDANIEPVFFAFPDHAGLEEVIHQVTQEKPEYDFISTEGFGHKFWLVSDPALIDKITGYFAELPALYIADGHHRTAAAARVGLEKAKRNPDHRGDEEYNYFMAVCFPASQLRIMDYNRVVKDLNGLTPEELLKKLAANFEIENKGQHPYRPQRLHEFSMYLDGSWYALTAKPGTYDDQDPIGVLDVTISSDLILRDILNIVELRTDKRIDFVGGLRGLEELQHRVDSGEMKMALALYPVSMKQLMDIADTGNIMPPKTTWFEPKLRSGLVIHKLS